MKKLILILPIIIFVCHFKIFGQTGTIAFGTSEADTGRNCTTICKNFFAGVSYREGKGRRSPNYCTCHLGNGRTRQFTVTEIPSNHYCTQFCKDKIHAVDDKIENTASGNIRHCSCRI